VEYAQVAFSSLERLFVKEKDSLGLVLEQMSPDLVYELRNVLFTFGMWQRFVILDNPALVCNGFEGDVVVLVDFFGEKQTVFSA
jgi:hypothetical protein